MGWDAGATHRVIPIRHEDTIWTSLVLWMLSVRNMYGYHELRGETVTECTERRTSNASQIKAQRIKVMTDEHHS